MFNRKDFDKHFEKFDEDFEKAQKFAKAWFVFVVCLALALLGGGVFVVYRVLLHFGIL